MSILTRQASSEQIRSHIGKPLAPCVLCGCPLFNVTHWAQIRCAACDSGRLNNCRGDDPEVRRHVPLRLICATAPDGRTVAEEFSPFPTGGQ